MRAYRFVDADGKPLPYMEDQRVKWAEEGKLLDVSNSAAMVKLFESRVLPEGTPGFPKGGWLCTGAEEMSNAEWRKMPAEEKKELQKGWRVYYEADVPLRMDDVVIFRTGDIVWPDPADFNPSTVKETDKRMVFPSLAAIDMFRTRAPCRMPWTAAKRRWN